MNVSAFANAKNLWTDGRLPKDVHQQSLRRGEGFPFPTFAIIDFFLPSASELKAQIEEDCLRRQSGADELPLRGRSRSISKDRDHAAGLVGDFLRRSVFFEIVPANAKIRDRLWGTDFGVRDVVAAIVCFDGYR